MLTNRTVVKDAADSVIDSGNSVRPPLNVTPLYIRVGDKLDFGIDWSAWLKANAARLKTSTWAAAGAPVASPQAPTLTSPLMDADTGVTSVLVDATAAAVADQYYLENTIVITPANSPLAWADRTIVRRINIKVTSG